MSRYRDVIIIFLNYMLIVIVYVKIMILIMIRIIIIVIILKALNIPSNYPFFFHLTFKIEYFTLLTANNKVHNSAVTVINLQ